MKIERDERRFDFHDIGLAIKRAREASGMTQEQLAYIVDRSPRTIMYNENDGQHPSLNTFYQLVTMFDISVDQYFYPSKNTESSCRKRINAMLNSLDEKDAHTREECEEKLKQLIVEMKAEIAEAQRQKAEGTLTPQAVEKRKQSRQRKRVSVSENNHRHGC